MSKLKGKKALVTGASRGVGHQIALALAEQGCDLVLHSRKPEGTRALAETLQAQGVAVTSFAAELSVPEQVERLIQQVLEAYQIFLSPLQLAVFVSGVAFFALYTRHSLTLYAASVGGDFTYWDVVLETVGSAYLLSFWILPIALRGRASTRCTMRGRL